MRSKSRSNMKSNLLTVFGGKPAVRDPTIIMTSNLRIKDEPYPCNSIFRYTININMRENTVHCPKVPAHHNVRTP